MAKDIRSLKLPSRNLVYAEAIVSAQRFDTGVGLLDLRNRMIGWIDIEDEDAEVRECLFEVVLDFFDVLINDRRRAQQPDWNALNEQAHALALARKAQ